MVALLAACGPSDPWAGAPGPPPPTAETWTLALHGRPLGVETRWRDGDEAYRRRTLSVLADGEAHPLRSAWTVTLQPDGRAAAWTVWEPGRTRSGAGPAWIPDVVPPPASGALPVLDADRLVVTDVAVERDADEVRWRTPAGVARVRLADGRPVAASLAGVTAERVAGPVELPPPLDVARVLSIPTTSFPSARGALVGEYLVGGRPVRVDAPTWAELPAERDAVRRLVREVGDAITAAAVPGGDTDALATGRGDCTEHARALLERLTAAGFRARPAAGRLYADDGELGPRLVPHAWTEVELGGRWVGADAALGQFPADASHLRLGDDPADLASTDGDEIVVLRLE